jgi:Uma2 family endonuclease
LSIPSPRSYLTVDEYFKLEEKASVRHEYVDGQIFAMTGATYRHVLIVGNVYSLLRSLVKGKGGPCQVGTNDLKVRVEASNCFYYPDVLVSCGKFDPDSVVAARPVLIVEVLSKSTSTIDRREKLLAYRQVETVQEYLIVHQKKRLVRLHRNNELGHWEALEFGAGTEIPLSSIPGVAATIQTDLIYEGIDDVGKMDSGVVVRENTGAASDEDDLDW